MGEQLAAQMSQFLETSGLPAVFIILLLKEMGIPVPLPGDFVMLFAGVQAARGLYSPWLAVAAIVLAAGLGSSVIYLLARGPGRAVIYRFGRYIGLTPARLDFAAQAVQRRGIAAVLIGRSTPGLGLPTTAAAGIAGLSFQLYIIGALISAAAFAGLHILLGFLAGPLVLDAMASMNLPVLPIIVGLALLGLVFWLVRRARGKDRDKHGVADSIGAWEHAACPACMAIAGLGERVFQERQPLLPVEALN